MLCDFGVRMVSNFVLDYMHVSCLGTMKRLFMWWLGKRCNRCNIFFLNSVYILFTFLVVYDCPYTDFLTYILFYINVSHNFAAKLRASKTKKRSFALRIQSKDAEYC